MQDRVAEVLASEHPFGVHAGGQFPDWFREWIAKVAPLVAGLLDAPAETTTSQQWTAENERCLNDGGHLWNDADPGDPYKCTRCGWLGARNWPTIDECGGAQ